MPPRPFLGLVALGPVDPEILRHLRTVIAKFLDLPARILAPLPLPSHTFHLVRQQYHSTQLLEHLLSQNKPGLLRILGLTAVDLYIHPHLCLWRGPIVRPGCHRLHLPAPG